MKNYWKSSSSKQLLAPDINKCAFCLKAMLDWLLGWGFEVTCVGYDRAHGGLW